MDLAFASDSGSLLVAYSPLNARMGTPTSQQPLVRSALRMEAPVADEKDAAVRRVDSAGAALEPADDDALQRKFAEKMRLLEEWGDGHR